MGGGGVTWGINCTGKDWALASKQLAVSRNHKKTLPNPLHLIVETLKGSKKLLLAKEICNICNMSAHHFLKEKFPLKAERIKAYRRNSFAIQYKYPVG